MANEVEISIIAVDAASNILRNIGSQFGVLGEVAVSALTAVGGALTDFIGDAESKEVILARMNAILEATGGVSGQTSQSLQDLANSLSSVTTYQDETILSVETLMLRFKSLGGQYFPEATKAALDLASATGQDASTAARQLGVALEDPATGLGLLRRSGIVFTEEQKKQIEAMQKAGDTAGAQRMLLDALAGTVGGVAQKLAQTTRGEWTMFNNKLLEIKDSIGTAFLPAMSSIAAALDKFVSSPGFQNFITGLITGIQSFIAEVQGFKPPPEIMNFFNLLSMWWRVNGPSIIMSSQEIFTGLQNMFQELGPEIGAFVNQNLAQIGAWFVDNGPLIGEFIHEFADGFVHDWIPAIEETWRVVGPILTDVIGLLLQLITWLMQANIAFKNFSESAVSAFKDIGSGFQAGPIISKKNTPSQFATAHRAAGGPAGGLTLVGETGPELVNLPLGSYVNSASASRNMTGGNTFVFNFPNLIGSAQDIKTLVINSVRQMQLEGRIQ